MIVVGDSLLRGTEAPTCRPDALSREVCCLPGARIRDATERLLSLVQSAGCYPLLLFYVSTSDTARSSLRSIKKDYRALGAVVGDAGAQAVFSSIVPVKGKEFERASRIWRINQCLRDWCHSQGLGYLDHGTRFEKPGLLGADGVQSVREGEGHRLAKLVKRTLN